KFDGGLVIFGLENPAFFQDHLHDQFVCPPDRRGPDDSHGTLVGSGIIYALQYAAGAIMELLYSSGDLPPGGDISREGTPPFVWHRTSPFGLARFSSLICLYIECACVCSITITCTIIIHAKHTILT